MLPLFIHLDACDFLDYPPGGTLSFARQMRKVFGSRMALAGIVTDDTPSGQWVTKEFDGAQHLFFAIGRMRKRHSKPFIPARLISYYYLKRQISNLRRLGVRRVFTQTPQFMLALRRADWESICFCFAGTSNSVTLSRYSALRKLGGLYERWLFKSLAKNADCILAAADKHAIEQTITRSDGLLKPGTITTFPTRYDGTLFHRQDRNECRHHCGLPSDSTIIAVNGRLSWVKGWRFVIDAYMEYRKHDPTALLLFIGDGEDRGNIELGYADWIRRGAIRITGHVTANEVSTCLGAADVVMVGSYQEGWPTAMVEALACCKPIVSTDVSGARDMVIHGENGFILSDRDPIEAAKAIARALRLENAAEKAHTLSERYNLRSLASDLESLWLS